METHSRSFPIRNGQCHIYEDRIEIKTGGLLEKLGAKSVFIPYLLLMLAFALAMLLSVWIVNYFLAAFFASAMLFVLYFLWTHRQLSVARIIPREQIESIEYHPAIPGEARASFKIWFRPRRQKRYRVIYLPGTSVEGAAIAQSAQMMFREEGLLA